MSEKTSKKTVPPAITLIKSGYRAYLARTNVKREKWMRLRVGFFEKRSEAVSKGKKIMYILSANETCAVEIGEEEVEEFGGY